MIEVQCIVTKRKLFTFILWKIQLFLSIIDIDASVLGSIVSERDSTDFNLWLRISGKIKYSCIHTTIAIHYCRVNINSLNIVVVLKYVRYDFTITYGVAIIYYAGYCTLHSIVREWQWWELACIFIKVLMRFSEDWNNRNDSKCSKSNRYN